jgi:hypothetical protein
MEQNKSMRPTSNRASSVVRADGALGKAIQGVRDKERRRAKFKGLQGQRSQGGKGYRTKKHLTARSFSPRTAAAARRKARGELV